MFANIVFIVCGNSISIKLYILVYIFRCVLSQSHKYLFCCYFLLKRTSQIAHLYSDFETTEGFCAQVYLLLCFAEGVYLLPQFFFLATKQDRCYVLSTNLYVCLLQHIFLAVAKSAIINSHKKYETTFAQVVTTGCGAGLAKRSQLVAEPLVKSKHFGQTKTKTKSTKSNEKRNCVATRQPHLDTLSFTIPWKKVTAKKPNCENI